MPLLCLDQSGCSQMMKSLINFKEYLGSDKTGASCMTVIINFIGHDDKYCIYLFI